MKMNTALTTWAIAAMTWFCCERADVRQGSRGKLNLILVMTDAQGKECSVHCGYATRIDKQL